MNHSVVFALFLGVVTLLRWWWLAPHDLPPSAAYLALCGFSPAVAYFDGPAGTAMSVAFGTRFGGAGALGGAFLWPVFAAVATVALYALANRLIGRRGALASAVLLNLLPAFNAAAVTPTCAMPLAMAALGFFACLWRALTTSSVVWWFGAGLCAAGGLFFDYLAWFFLPAALVIMLASHRWRPQLLEPGFWVSLLPSLALLVWLLAWNAEHGWVHFIGGTWQTATSLHLRLLPGAVYEAALGASPLVLLALAAGIYFALREVRVAPRAKFLALPALVGVAIAAYLAMRGEPARAAGLLAAALAIPLLAWVPVGSRVAALVFMTSALWTAGAFWLHPARPATVTAQVAQEIEKLRTANTADPAAPVFLIARDAPLASALALHLPDTSFVAPGHPPVYVVESPYADSQYALWPRYDQFVDAPPPAETAADPFTEQDGANPFLWRSALYITPQKSDELPQSITAAFAAHRLLAEITTPSGEVLRVYLCSEYETLPL